MTSDDNATAYRRYMFVTAVLCLILGIGTISAWYLLVIRPETSPRVEESVKA